MDGSMGPCIYDSLHLFQDPADLAYDPWQQKLQKLTNEEDKFIRNKYLRGSTMKKIIAIFITLFICAALTACGGKKEEKGSDVPQTQQAEKTDPVENPTEKQAGTVELAEKTDDTHYVFLLEPAYHVFEHEGDTITGYYTYIKYDDALNAEAAYHAFQDKYENNPEDWQGVDRAEIVGTAFVIYYSSDVYGGAPLSTIEKSYSEYKVD